jgi:hypothetical protein
MNSVTAVISRKPWSPSSQGVERTQISSGTAKMRVDVM